MKYGFGRLPSPADARDYSMTAAMRLLEPALRPVERWTMKKTLQQGQTNKCVGFCWAGWGICAPVEQKWGNPMGHDIYAACKAIDGIDGEGSTIRAGAQVMRSRGRIASYFFGGLEESLHYLTYHGPVCFGTLWTASMCRPSLVRGIIRPRGLVVGGHAWLAIGYKRPYVTLRNSWGPEWGRGGEARISVADLKALMDYDGEACAATEAPLPIGGMV